MALSMISLGDKASLAFELGWEAAQPGGTAAEATRGRMVVWVAGRAVWGDRSSAGGFSWSWVELLEHLARHWSHLAYEEADPLGLDVAPEDLNARAKARWLDLPEEEQEEEETALWAFLESHDLAAGLGGAYPASIYLLREGACMRIASKDRFSYVPLDVAKDVLGALGDVIARRLESLDDARARTSLAAWRERTAVTEDEVVGFVTGLAASDVATLTRSIPSSELVSTSQPLLAAARMARGALPVEEIALLLERVRGMQSDTWTKPLDARAREAASVLAGVRDRKPFEQGAEIARWYRAERLSNPTGRVEPEEILHDLQIRVETMKISSKQLDAVSVWGAGSSPLVVLNQRAPHARGNGKRATLAHEIGHLLMDRDGALPLGEVLGGRVPAHIEGRANAFAAELLLPQKLAAEAALSRPDAIEEVVRELSAAFGASHEVVAWQIRNGTSARLPARAFTFLRSLVQEPWRF